MKIIIRILIIWLMCSNSLMAQVEEHYFRDDESKEGGIIYYNIRYENSIIICGNGFEKTKRQPLIIRLDTLGNILWNSADNDNTNNLNHVVSVYRVIAGMDGFLYAMSLDAFTNSHAFWKVDPSTGTILWKVPFATFDYVYQAQQMIDYDSTRFLVAYFSSYGSYGHHTMFSFINKTNGSVISSYDIGNTSNHYYGFEIDDQKNIYYSQNDTIIKVDGANPSNVIWTQCYPTAHIAEYQHIYYDSTSGSVVNFGTQSSMFERGTIVKIDAGTGSLLSTKVTSANETRYSGMKYVDGKIFVMWRHIYTAADNDFYNTTCYEISTDSIIWDNAYSFTADITLDQTALALDVDQSNNVYVTGKYGQDGSWGILKLNGATGATLYAKKVDLDTNFFNRKSVGLGTYIFNNKPCFIGELQTSIVNNLPRSKFTFFKLEPSNGNILIKKYFGCNHDFSAKTICICNAIYGKTMVMKQTGRMVTIESYNYANSLEWSKSFSKHYFLTGYSITTSNNGDIFFSAASKGELDSSPFYQTNTDSIYVFHLNSSGEILKVYSFYVGMTNVYPLELLADNNTALLFYQKNNLVYYRKICYPSISPEYNTLSYYFSTGAGTKYSVDISSNKSFLFGNTGAAVRMYEINKTTSMQSLLMNIPGNLKTVNHVVAIDTSTFLLCGKSNSDRECIELINKSLQDTIWTKQLSSISGEVIKSVLDKQKNYLYTVSHVASNIIVRKLSVLTGIQKWMYTFNGVSDLDDGPADISYDTLRNLILIAGYETFGANKYILILTIDTIGIPVDTISRAGDFAGDNKALCTYCLSNNAQWVGGNLNKNQFGQGGFIYELAEASCTASSSVQNITSCGNYSWNGIICNSSGIYKDTIPNVSGCDSIMFLVLTVFHVNDSVTQIGNILTADNSTCNYQWVDCNNAYSPIIGQTNQNFSPTINGNFAVIVSQNLCVDTSNCISVTTFSVEERSNIPYVYPNPTSGKIHIQIPLYFGKPKMITVYDYTGHIQLVTEDISNIDLTPYAKGFYMLVIINDQEQKLTLKVINE